MPRASTVYEILIASPSDVSRERTILAEVIEDWNSSNSRTRGISLQALRWELDGVPSFGESPQETLNKQLVKDADILIAVFGWRLGTPTKTFPSGTAEEIEHFAKSGKPVLLYFSEAPIPHHHDPDQFRRLREYRARLEPNSLSFSFPDENELRRLVTRNLAAKINEIASLIQAPKKRESEIAKIILRAEGGGHQGIRIRHLIGEIENTTSRRFNEYSVNLYIPKSCLSFNNTIQALEVKSQLAEYRKLRSSETTHRTPIHPGDTHLFMRVEIAVDHLPANERALCLKMPIIAEAHVEGQTLKFEKLVEDFFA